MDRTSWARALLAALILAELWDLDHVPAAMHEDCRRRAMEIADRVIGEWLGG